MIVKLHNLKCYSVRSSVVLIRKLERLAHEALLNQESDNEPTDIKTMTAGLQPLTDAQVSKCLKAHELNALIPALTC